MVVPINEAREEMANSLINMFDFTITIPLTNLTKKIHTNSFIKLNTKLFDADYLWEIYKAMGKTSATRFVSFRQNYWYVSEVEVNYKNQTMKLKLLPLPSVPQYKKDELKASSSGKSGKTIDKTNSGSTNSSLKIRKPKWMSKSDQRFLEDLVKKAVGTANSDLKRAKNCVDLFNKYHTYRLYYDFDYGKNFKRTWKAKGLNCGDGALCMAYMFYALGLDPKMHLGSAGAIGEKYGHYWLEVKIDGKTYFTDHANCRGCAARSRLSTSGTLYGHHPHAGSIVSWK